MWTHFAKEGIRLNVHDTVTLRRYVALAVEYMRITEAMRKQLEENQVCRERTQQSIKDNLQGQRVRNGQQAGAAFSQTLPDPAARPCSA
eukprot:353840-Chlamydomonas_euryale.AAC.5